MRKQTKAPAKKAIEKECYALIQQIALLQDPNCIICGIPSNAGHHLFNRSRLATAFHPEAVRGLCLYCHSGAHQYPVLFGLQMIRLFGRRYGELQRLSQEIIPDMDFSAKRTELKANLVELERRVA